MGAAFGGLGASTHLPLICLLTHECLQPQVAKDPKLDRWELYLVDWGYNTSEERERAAQNPRIQVVNTQQFAALLSQ